MSYSDNFLDLGRDGSLLIHCSFEEKDIAKSVGARWDKPSKTWIAAFTVKNVEFLVENLTNATISDVVAERLERDGEIDKKLRSLRELAQKDTPVKFRVPGVKISLYNYQKIGVMYATAGMPGLLLGDEMGLGKALTLDSDVLTPSGWKMMGDIRIGDKVVGRNGNSTKVVGVYPQGEKKIYRVTFSDGASVDCCDEHLWSVNTPTRINRGCPFLTMTLGEIMQSGLTRKNGKNGNRWNWYIPMVDPVEFKKTTLPIHPYVLGVLLGDGSLTKNRLSFTSADPEIVGRIAGLMGNDWHVRKCCGKYAYEVCRTSIVPNDKTHAYLRYAGVKGKRSFEKFVPKEFLFSSVEDRLELLRGLMDTDGTVSKGKRGDAAQFCTTSDKLRDDVVFLCRSLGGVAMVSSKDNPFYYDKNRKKVFCRKAWIVTIALPSRVCPFWLSRKASIYPNIRAKYKPTRAIVKVEPIGVKPAQCLRVDAEDHLFVVKDFVVTHNSLQCIATACWKREYEGAKNCLVVTPASLKWNWPLEIEKFTDAKYVVVDGTPEERIRQWLRADVFFHIVNYELVLEDLFGGREIDLNDDDSAAVILRKEKQMASAKHRMQVLAPVRERFWDMMAIDECFHPDARVRCADGSLKRISEIVVNKLDVLVDSFNFETGKIEQKPVIGWFKNSVRQCYKVTTDGGTSYPTGSHKYITPYGEKTVDELCVGSKVLFSDFGFSDVQVGALAGSLLGDGSIDCGSSRKERSELSQSCKRRYRVRWNHSTKQEEYAHFKHILFGGNCVVVENKGFGDKLVSVRTRSLLSETVYRKICPDGKKRVSQEWLDLVNDLGLALWFLDDGSVVDSSPSDRWMENISIVKNISSEDALLLSRRSLSKKYVITEHVAREAKKYYMGKGSLFETWSRNTTKKQYVRFHTEGFCCEEVELLSGWLLSRWGISSSVLTSNGYFYISLTQDGTKKLFSIISKYVPESMRYKLGSCSCEEYSLDVGSEDFVIKKRMYEGSVFLKEKYKIPCTTYNIEVSDNHNYFVGNTLVSNCHSVKNHASKRTRNIKKLKSGFRMALSGTPMDGKLEDLHSIMEWVAPGLFEPRTRFLQKHAEFDFWGRVVRYKAIDEVKKRIEPFFLRRLKKDVLKDLPDKVYKDRYLTLSAKELKTYKELADRGHIATQDAQAMTAIIRCKQFCDWPELLGEKYEGEKMVAFREIIQEVVVENKHKAIIFSQYSTICDILCKVVKKMGLKFLYICGNTPKKARASMQAEFNDDESIQLMIGTDAMSTGLNFTSADYVINYDDAWSPAIMKQREDRAHRIGQKNVVTVVNFICRDTVEERIRDVLLTKGAISSQTLGDETEDQIVSRLGAKDIAKLL
jgi:intein/homing endonuclease